MIPIQKTIRFMSALIILLSLIIAMLLIPNFHLFDETLLPEIQAMPHSSPGSRSSNGLVYAYGIDAPEGVAPHAAGEEIIALMQNKVATGKWGPLTFSETEAIYKQRKVASFEPNDYTAMQPNFALENVTPPLKQSRPSRQKNDWQQTWWRDYSSALDCNSFERSDCFIQVSRQLKSIPLQDMRLVLRLQRYRKLIQFNQYSDAVEMKLPSPLGTPMVNGRINLAQAYINDPTSSFLITWQQDTSFWLRVLRGSQSLMSKHTAISVLRYNLQSINSLINERQLTPEQQQTIRQLLLPPQNLDFAQALRTAQHHFQELENTWAYMAHSPTKVQWIYWLRQDNASANDYYRRITAPLLQLTQLKPADFASAAKKIQQKEHIGFSLSPYNLGENFLQENHRSYRDLFIYLLAATNDTLAIYQMINVQLDIKQKQPADIAAFIRSATQHAPYTNETLSYSAETDELGFHCFNKQDNCTINLRDENTINETAY
ncbi:MAG: hypothetical protein B0W54_15610 [Cellvibrio sp. 79]|nr:MAG: hypothetical protein B0W54_15610 [Cellvibrio sp. 79]